MYYGVKTGGGHSESGAAGRAPGSAPELDPRLAEHAKIGTLRERATNRPSPVPGHSARFATRATCASADAGLMCGSRPLADPVTASAGIGAFGVNTNGALSSLKALISFTSSSPPPASLNRSRGADDS